MRGPRTFRLRPRAAGLGCGLVLALAAGCARPAPPAGGAPGAKAEKARRDAEAAASAAVGGAADAQAKAVPGAAARREWRLFGGRVVVDQHTWQTSVSAQRREPPTPTPGPTVPKPPAEPPAVVRAQAPKSPPRPGPPAVIRERVTGGVATSEAEAEEDALGQARDLVEQRLAALDPPVRYKPTVAEVKAEFVRKDSRTARPPDAEQRAAFAREGITVGLTVVEYDVEVTADQVRELRTQERAAGALRVVGLLTAVALAGFLFLRADEWTKGYLTSWLALAAVVLAGGAAAALIFV